MEKWTAENIPSLDGTLAVVTGANSGIGFYTSLELARAGAEVVLAARSAVKGKEAVDRIKSELPNAKVRLELLDLASLESVRAFARRFETEGKLDLLINNAGVMSIPKRETTQDGFEKQFGTNYLGPFALTMLLLPMLKRSSRSRVTTVSSSAAAMGPKKINFDDLQSQKDYSPWKAYCQAKLADLMMMLELGRRANAAGWSLISNGAHPGYARTNLQTSGPGKEKPAVQKLIEVFFAHDAFHGALPTLRAATSTAMESGAYFAPGKLFGMKGDPVRIAIPKPAQDEEAARGIWEIAEELTGTRSPFPPVSRPSVLRTWRVGSIQCISSRGGRNADYEKKLHSKRCGSQLAGDNQTWR